MYSSKDLLSSLKPGFRDLSSFYLIENAMGRLYPLATGWAMFIMVYWFRQFMVKEKSWLQIMINCGYDK